MSQFQLTREQNEIINHIIHETEKVGFTTCWRGDRGKFLTIIGGYAGTGKTTILAYLRQELHKKYPNISVAFVTYTGKASSVLKTKLQQNNVNICNDYVGTIHGLIYKPKTVWDSKLKCYVITEWKLKEFDELPVDFIIIDEGSMVSFEIWKDLNKYGLPIVVMGDHGQLPPVSEKKFSLMSTPDFKLTTVHRQALNSPIIALSAFVRKNGFIPGNQMFSQNVFKFSWNDPKCKFIWDNKVIFDENLIVLCGFNTTRCGLNRKIRDKLSFGNERIPLPGERIICLKNDHHRGIMNGQIATIMWFMPECHDLYRMTLNVDGIPEPLETLVATNKGFDEVTYTMYDESDLSKKQYKYAVSKSIGPINYFDYGYAISVHKSQGSEWDKVILFEQRTPKWNDEYYARWLYTGITRAREKLFVISDYWD